MRLPGREQAFLVSCDMLFGELLEALADFVAEDTNG